MKLRLLLVIAAALLVCQPVVLAELDGDRATLVIYDSPGEYGSESGTLQSLVRTLMVYGADVDIVGMAAYPSGMMNEYPHVVVLCLNGHVESPTLYADITQYGGKLFWMGRDVDKFIDARQPPGIGYQREKPDYGQLLYDFGGGAERFLFQGRSAGQRLEHSDGTTTYGTLMNGAEQWPFVVRSGNIFVASLFNDNTILHYALSNILQDFYEISPPGGLYIKLDFVYPISDYAQLAAMAEHLGNKGLPFMIVLMPVYENADLPAMTEYAELIHYMQRNGGVPVIHFPVFNPVNFTSTPDPVRVKELMQLALDNYTSKGVYPLAFEAPESLLYHPGLQELYERFTTYIAEIGTGKDNYTVKPTAGEPVLDGRFFRLPRIAQSVNELKLPADGDADMTRLALSKAFSATRSPGVSLAVSFPSFMDLDIFKDQVDMIAGMGFHVRDITKLDHKVSWDKISIECKQGMVTAGGEFVSLRRPLPLPTPEPAPPMRETQVSATNARIRFVNITLTVVAALACAFLVYAFWSGWRLNLKKFFRR